MSNLNNIRLGTLIYFSQYYLYLLKEQKKCRLQVPFDGQPKDVAYGTVLPSGPHTLISFHRLPIFYARVTLDLIIEGYESTCLPMTFDNKCTLVEAKGDILPWPACYIVVTDEVIKNV